MAFVQADLDRINAAISSGVLEVHYQDRSVRYQDIKGLLSAKSDIENELEKNSSTAIVRQIRPLISNGW
jgi:hypothetical protein